jgi:hypothetical protein
MHVPGATNVTMVPLTVQMEFVVVDKLTGSPEVAMRALSI